MRTEQLTSCLDTSERERMVRELNKQSGVRFVLTHTATFIRWYAQKHNMDTLERFAVRLDDMVEELGVLGL